MAAPKREIPKLNPDSVILDVRDQLDKIYASFKAVFAVYGAQTTEMGKKIEELENKVKKLEKKKK